MLMFKDVCIKTDTLPLKIHGCIDGCIATCMGLDQDWEKRHDEPGQPGTSHWSSPNQLTQLRNPDA